jgi:hypothetical protein
MYSRSTWGGPTDPFILVKYINATNEVKDPLASLIIFEWKDRDFVGIPDPDGWGNVSAGATLTSIERLGICSDDFVNQGMCNKTNIGEFIVAPNATEKSNALILTKSVHLDDPPPIHYSIKKTGYYCVVTDVFTAEHYNAVVEFRNAYGELPATQIPKLPFYGAITIVYALMAVYWGFLYYQHRHDICKYEHNLSMSTICRGVRTY